jgi:hypothetical protein
MPIAKKAADEAYFKASFLEFFGAASIKKGLFHTGGGSTFV